MEIGEKLIEARKQKNLTLDDIQEMTKIQKRYLQSIEQEDYEALPGRFYARAFIKEYAQAVDLDYHELLANFDEDTIDVQEEKSYKYSRLSRSSRNRPLKSTSIFSLLPTIIVIILVIGIIFIAWTLYQQTVSNTELPVEDRQENDEIIRTTDDRPTDDGAGDVATEQKESEEKTIEEEEVTESEDYFEMITSTEDANSTPELRFNYSGDTIELTYEVTDTTYIAIEGASGTTYMSGELNPISELEPIDVTSEDRIHFNIGFSPGITLRFNDVELEYPVDPNEKVHQKLLVELNQIE